MNYDYKLFKAEGSSHNLTIEVRRVNCSDMRADGSLVEGAEAPIILIQVSDIYLAQFERPLLEALNAEAPDIIDQAFRIPNLQDGSVVRLTTTGITQIK